MLVMIAALLVAAPMTADKAAPPVPPPAEKLICHDMPMPGTKLVTQHMCGTRAQWNDYELVMRQDMQRVYQTNYGH